MKIQCLNCGKINESNKVRTEFEDETTFSYPCECKNENKDQKIIPVLHKVIEEEIHA